MTIGAAMAALDHARPANQMGDEEKIQLLSDLDSRVFKEIFKTHEGDFEKFAGYGPLTDPDTRLLIPEPYANVYLHYLESQLDYRQGEIERYNNSSAAFTRNLQGGITARTCPFRWARFTFEGGEKPCICRR